MGESVVIVFISRHSLQAVVKVDANAYPHIDSFKNRATQLDDNKFLVKHCTSDVQVCETFEALERASVDRQQHFSDWENQHHVQKHVFGTHDRSPYVPPSIPPEWTRSATYYVRGGEPLDEWTSGAECIFYVVEQDINQEQDGTRLDAWQHFQKSQETSALLQSNGVFSVQWIRLIVQQANFQPRVVTVPKTDFPSEWLETLRLNAKTVTVGAKCLYLPLKYKYVDKSRRMAQNWHPTEADKKIDRISRHVVQAVDRCDLPVPIWAINAITDRNHGYFDTNILVSFDEDLLGEIFIFKEIKYDWDGNLIPPRTLPYASVPEMLRSYANK